MTDLRIILATPHAGYEQRVRRAFAENLNGELRRYDLEPGSVTPDQLALQLGDSSPDVVAIGPDVEVDVALALARQPELTRPEISVLLISEPTNELWQQALRSGVRDVIAPDAVDADVRAAFDRALEVATRSRHNLAGEPAGPETGRVITVLSPKGGSGKTSVASNLAVGLALAEPNRVAVVDLDLQFGDVATALRLSPDHSIVDAARGPAALDAMELKSFLTAHPSNLWVLCGPELPADGDEVPAERVKAIVQALAQEFAYVVIDTGAGLDEHTLSVLDVSTDFVLVAAMDVPSVRSIRKEVDVLDQLGMTHQRRHLVINRADSKVGLDAGDVEAIVGQPVDVALPSSRMVPLSMNQGSPLVESQPRSPVARQLTTLIDRFLDRPAERSGGVLKLMRSSR
jgi:pilus assembly protein CpaE